MTTTGPIPATNPRLAAFAAHIDAKILTPEDARLADALIADGQEHLFADWDAPGVRDEEKIRLLNTLRTANGSYPGGLAAYIANARTLLAGAVAEGNPFAGYSPEQPAMVDLSGFGPEYDGAEAAGLAAFADTAVVLVAGGLGERLGYHGIKLDIPVEATTGTTYLAHYAGVIHAASRRLGKVIPLIIMTSRDTHEGTMATLTRHNHFGLAPDQIIVLRQELVPALADIQGRLALDKPYGLLMKPHGHGDIHMLLHTSGTAARLAAAGTRYLLFIQDTNGQVFNAAFAALGVSEREGYDFNSIAVNRIPGEAVGGIARLVKPGHPDLTLNVEYNLLDPLLRDTVSPEGDVPNARGFSRFPGNINLLVVRLTPYLRVLEASGGIVAEFVNPKFSDDTRTRFKKPARLETLMQDLPKFFDHGEKVGVTVFDRAWCFSACKNNLADAALKHAENGPPESASSAENDFYLAGRTRLRAGGMEVADAPTAEIRGVPFTSGPRVILRPTFALTLADVRERVKNGLISGASTLVLDGDVWLEDIVIEDGGTLWIEAVPGARVTVRGLHIRSGNGFDLVKLSDGEMQSPDVPEYLRIRGYRIEDRGANKIRITQPGKWNIGADGILTR